MAKSTGPVSAEVLEIGRRCAAVMYELVNAVHRLDVSGEWRVAGIPTAAHWVAHALDLELSTAREWLRIGQALERLPALDEAFRSGQLSYSKIRTLTRWANEKNVDDLKQIATQVPAGRLRMALGEWLERHEDPTERRMRHRKDRYVTWRTEADGMITGSFKLPPLEGGRLGAAIDAVVAQREASGKTKASLEHAETWPSAGQQRADALVALLTEGGAQVETELVVHVRADGCSMDDGTPISESIVHEIAPHSFLRALIHDAESRPINASGRHRHPTARQKRVVKERDRVCVDCGGSQFLQYDHVPDYNSSQRTVVDELQPRCAMCHRKRHRDDAA